MPHPHNHEGWESRRVKFKADWKDEYQAKKNPKSEANAVDRTKKSAGGNLSLGKSFKSAPATQVMLSDQEYNQLVDDFLNGNFPEDGEIKQYVRNRQVVYSLINYTRG